MATLDMKALAPLVGPLLKQAFDGVVVPAIQAEADKVTSPDLKLAIETLLPAIKAFVDAEIDNLSK